MVLEQIGEAFEARGAGFDGLGGPGGESGGGAGDDLS